MSVHCQKGKGTPLEVSPSGHAVAAVAQPKRRIAYVLSLKGGIPSFNFREIESMLERGFQIHLFATKVSEGIYNPKSAWPVHRPSIPKSILSSLFWAVRKPRVFMRLFSNALRDKALPELALASQYAREMKNARVEAIHCHFADRKMFVTYFCSSLLGLPFTVTVHSHELVFYSNRKLFMKALNSSAKIITICDYNRDYLIREAHIPADRIETIRLQIPVDDFMTDDRLKVLTVAKFYDYKGYDVLIEAAKLLKDEPFVFWIVGEGPVDVAGMAADLVSRGTVKMLGPVNEEVLKILYQACDVFCLPSKTAPSGQKEGLPVSIMEAMAYSKPVVSTVHAGIPELVESILVKENDPEGIAKALRTYAADPGLRKREGARNRERVVRMHGKDNIDRLAKVLESV